MKIDKNTVVSVSYILHAGETGKEKSHIETADKSHPLTFLFGAGGMIPGFEQGLNGMKKGDDFDFNIEPEMAYGVTDESAIVKLPIDIFKHEGVIDFNMLKTGNVLPMSDQHGNMLQGKVLSFDDKEVSMDFNHQLAGMELNFQGTVLDVREASAEEISHGHVHTGEHGH